MVFWGGLRLTVLTLVVILWFYVLLFFVANKGDLSVLKILDRLTWHNASARPPVILVIVVLGWSVVINRCRSAGMKLEMVLGPGSLLPARATLRCGLALLNVILLTHLVHFVAEETLGASQPWYLMCDLALHLVIFIVFLYPPALATALNSRPSDASLLVHGKNRTKHYPTEKKGTQDLEDHQDFDSTTTGNNHARDTTLCQGTTSNFFSLNEGGRRYLVSGSGSSSDPVSPPTEDDWYENEHSDDDIDEPARKFRSYGERGLMFPESRSGLARAIRDSLFAPFAPVTFWHVIVADYATSLAKALADLQITTCVAASASHDYFFSHHVVFTGTTAAISTSDAIFDRYKRGCGASLANACALGLPFWCRFAQCIKCYAQTRERKHLINALKYCSAFPLVACGFIRKNTHPTDTVNLRRAQNLLIIAAVINSSFSFAWDVTMDWGLFRPKRRAIVLAKYSPYMAASAYALLLTCNLGMRFAWAVSVFSHAGASSAAARLFALEAVEVARRTVWAVFRIELEYIARDCPVYPQRAIQRAVHTAIKRKMTTEPHDLRTQEQAVPLLNNENNNTSVADRSSATSLAVDRININKHQKHNMPPSDHHMHLLSSTTTKSDK